MSPRQGKQKITSNHDLSSPLGPVHPGLCPCLPLGQGDGQGVLWAAEGSRDGGNMLVAPKGQGAEEGTQ